MNILEKANQIINCRSEEKDRMYGPIDEGMEIAAQIFNLIAPVGQTITPEGMYLALVALKLSRQHFNHKTDNLLDAVAYLGALNNYIDSKNVSDFTNITMYDKPELPCELPCEDSEKIELPCELPNDDSEKTESNVVCNYKPY